MDNKKMVDLNAYRQMREKEFIIDAYEAEELYVAELMCVKCFKRWFGMVPYNVLLGELECPQCHAKGTIIDTGQSIPDKDDLMEAAESILEEYLHETEAGDNNKHE